MLFEISNMIAKTENWIETLADIIEKICHNKKQDKENRRDRIILRISLRMWIYE